MSEPIKLPPLTVKMLMDVFGLHADIPPALLCTSWKDGIDIDETSMRAQMLVEAYARLAIEQNTAEHRAEVERLRAELSATTERLENRAGTVRALCAETVRLEAELAAREQAMLALDHRAQENLAKWAEARAELTRLTTLRPASEWHDDFGDVLWWRLPVEEPPYVGSPMEYGWRDDYYTHFSPLPDWVSQVLPEGTNPRKDGRWDNP
jgi:hypothetical protein